MNEVTSLNQGDKIIVQKVTPRSAYKNYEMHTVTSFTDNEAVLDGGKYFLAKSEQWADKFTITPFNGVYVYTDSCNSTERHHRNAYTVNIVRRFTGENAETQAHKYLEIVNKLRDNLTPHKYAHGASESRNGREYATDAESIELKIMREKPHTLTTEAVEQFASILSSGVEAAVSNYIHNIKTLKEDVAQIALDGHEMLEQYHKEIEGLEPPAGGEVITLKDNQGNPTQFRFITGSIIVFEDEESSIEYTRQVVGGTSDAISIAYSDGTPAGTFVISYENNRAILMHKEAHHHDCCPSRPLRVESYYTILGTNIKELEERKNVISYNKNLLYWAGKKNSDLISWDVPEYLEPLLNAVLELKPMDPELNDINIIDRVVKRVENQLEGAEDKAREAGDKLINETREALMEYLEVKDAGYAF
jgi:hypothetical protein